MTQAERLSWLISYLLDERGEGGQALPSDLDERHRLYRSLVNMRPAAPISDEYLTIEDAYLQERLKDRGVVTTDELEFNDGVALWQGDITRLKVDAIVNAANAQMLGCFVPCHGCIDNAIHTEAGVRLRLACAELMERQKQPAATGEVMVTPGFNLPAAQVIHTVGPIVRLFSPTLRNKADLISCYQNCLAAASALGLQAIAFCCISTGEFRFPQRDAAHIAVNTVSLRRTEALAAGRPFPAVVFNVFKDTDREIYRELL